MKVFALFAFVPILIKADILCPNSKTTCPKDKQCCEVDGEYSCCDSDDDQDVPESKMKVYAGVEMTNSASFANAPLSANASKLHYGTCDLLNCPGTCCKNSWDGCCSYSLATCCGGDKCCPTFNRCCGDYCCGAGQDCCGTGCCGVLQTCCGNGCCGHLQTCCGNGCCEFGYNCCGSWCCKQGSRCGSGYKTCVSKGTAVSPEFVALLLMAASYFISHHL